MRGGELLEGENFLQLRTEQSQSMRQDFDSRTEENTDNDFFIFVRVFFRP